MNAQHRLNSERLSWKASRMRGSRTSWDAWLRHAARMQAAPGTPFGGGRDSKALSAYRRHTQEQDGWELVKEEYADTIAQREREYIAHCMAAVESAFTQERRMYGPGAAFRLAQSIAAVVRP